MKTYFIKPSNIQLTNTLFRTQKSKREEEDKPLKASQPNGSRFNKANAWEDRPNGA